MKIKRPVKRFRISLCVIRNLQLLVLVAVLFGLFPFPAAGDDPLEQKRVLILLPGQSDTPANPLIVGGIKSALAAGSEFRIDYFIEFMDRFRNTSQAHYRKLVALYRQKYADAKLDLVIPFSGLALDFALDQGDEIFPGTPVVFSGVFDEELPHRDLPANFTGILADIDFAGQLALALKIQPQTRRVAIVNGASSIELALETKIRKAFEPYTNRLDLIYLTRLPVGEVAEKVRNLPDHTVVLFYLFMLDGAGKGHLPAEAAAQLADVANAPVYGAFDTYLGHGILGGRLLSYEMLGVKAGEIGWRILRGAKPAEIPVSGPDTHLNLFDWRVLKRWGISAAQLPKGSIVRFQTPSFWYLYRWYVATAILLFVLQDGLVSFLLIQRTRRRRAEEQLTERLAFEEMLSALSARFVHLTPDRVDSQIAHDLKLLGEFLGVDRIRVFELSDTDQRMVVLHSFNASGVPGSALQLELDQLTWIRQKIAAGEAVHFADPADLPAEAGPEKAYLQSQGIQSGVVIPFTTGGKLQGALTLAMVSRPREWPQALIRRYGTIAEIIANALARKRSETALLQSRNFSRRILDSLNFHIAVLDRQGIILDVNESWRKFARENGATSGDQIGGGVNYLAICRRSADSGDALAESALAGIQSVLAGTREHFTLEYPCDSPTAKRWFMMRVIPFSGRKDGVIISHIENTHRKLAEIDLRNAYSEIEKLKTRLEAETAYLQEEIRLEHDFEGIVGRSAAIQYVLYKIEQVAATDASVLVLGETGTGKELICRAIHNNSLRKARPLIKVNCAALPSNLIESELFGHERGAFTGAQTRRKGRFEVADGGGGFSVPCAQGRTACFAWLGTAADMGCIGEPSPRYDTTRALKFPRDLALLLYFTKNPAPRPRAPKFTNLIIFKDYQFFITILILNCAPGIDRGFLFSTAAPVGAASNARVVSTGFRMILTLFKLKALAAKAKELRQTLQSLAAQMKMEPGCESSSVYQQVEDESDFLLIGAWKNREALNDHLQSIRFTVVMGARSLLRRPPEIMIHTVAQSATLRDGQSKIPVMQVLPQEDGKQAEAFAQAGRHAPCPCGNGRAVKTCLDPDTTDPDPTHAGTEPKT